MKEGGCNQIGGGGGVEWFRLGCQTSALFKKKKIDFKKMQVVHKM